MVKAFKCQREDLLQCNHAELVYFVLEKTLEIRESDLDTNERGDIERAISDWEKMEVICK
jgi:hypothetical protein